MPMKISKKYLEICAKLLKDCDPSLADGRIRDRFYKTLIEDLKTYYEDQEKILIKFCEKDSDENPIIRTNEKNEKTYTFSPENAPKVEEEILKLNKEQTEISCDQPEKIKELIENTTYKPKVGETIIIDELLVEIK